MCASPKISIIVPIYNVEKYLKQCLDSLADQTMKDIEVIMVNDGSTDRSGEIMHRYAEKYSHFFAYDKTNGGLGQARNFGVNYARGIYIAFVDSDDLVVPTAYEKMFSMVESTHSDMVIGNVMRFNGYKKFPSVLHQRFFAGDKLCTHITRNPGLIYDTTAWNKLYRKSFWERNHFSFPEGMLYEDIPVTFPAHYLAGSVDVLDEMVYLWRFRNFGDHSITQNRTDISNLKDRLKAVELLNNFFEDHMITGDLYEAKDFKLLSLDFLLYLNRLPEADTTYVNLLMHYVSDYLSEVPEKVLLKLKPIERMKYYFLAKRDKEKLFQLINFQKSAGFRRSKISRHHDGHYYANDPFHDSVPEKLLMVDHNLQVIHGIRSVAWRRSDLMVKGYGFIEKIDVPHKKDVTMKFVLVSEANGMTWPIDRIRINKSRMNSIRAAFSGRLRHLHFDLVYHYDWSSFSMRLPFDRQPFDSLPPGSYIIKGEIAAGGLIRSFIVGGGFGKQAVFRNMDDTCDMIHIKSSGSGSLYIIKDEKKAQPAVKC